MTADRPGGVFGLQFLDTNVLVCAYDRSAGRRRQTTRALPENLWRSGTGWVRFQVLQEKHVTVTRNVPRSLSVEESAHVLSGFQYRRAQAQQAENVIVAIRLQQPFPIAFWEAMIVPSALQPGCGVFCSEDRHAG